MAFPSSQITQPLAMGQPTTMSFSIPYPTSNTPSSTAGTPSESNRFSCPDCGRTYKAVETLNRHRKNHSSAVRYSCTFCTACFKRKDLLDRHVQIHDGGRSVLTSNRGSRACERCSRLKTKCDRKGSAPCTRCVKGGYICLCREGRGPRRRESKNGASQNVTRPTEAMSEMDVGEASSGILLDQVPVRSASVPGDFAHSGDENWTIRAHSWEQAHAWQWADVGELQHGVAQDGVFGNTIPTNVPAGSDVAWTPSFDGNPMPLDLPTLALSASASSFDNVGCCNDLSWCDCPPVASWNDGTIWTPGSLPTDMAAFSSVYPESRVTARASL